MWLPGTKDTTNGSGGYPVNFFTVKNPTFFGGQKIRRNSPTSRARKILHSARFQRENRRGARRHDGREIFLDARALPACRRTGEKYPSVSASGPAVSAGGASGSGGCVRSHRCDCRESRKRRRAMPRQGARHSPVLRSRRARWRHGVPGTSSLFPRDGCRGCATGCTGMAHPARGGRIRERAAPGWRRQRKRRLPCGSRLKR